jgi:hypothetical protein
MLDAFAGRVELNRRVLAERVDASKCERPLRETPKSQWNPYPRSDAARSLAPRRVRRVGSKAAIPVSASFSRPLCAQDCRHTSHLMIPEADVHRSTGPTAVCRNRADGHRFADDRPRLIQARPGGRQQAVPAMPAADSRSRYI